MLGEVVQELREEYGWSRPHLAEMAEVSLATINRLELYEMVPTVKTLEKIAEALGTTASVLLAEAEDEPVAPSRDTARKRAKARK